MSEQELKSLTLSQEYTAAVIRGHHIGRFIQESKTDTPVSLSSIILRLPTSRTPTPKKEGAEFIQDTDRGLWPSNESIQIVLSSEEGSDFFKVGQKYKITITALP